MSFESLEVSNYDAIPATLYDFDVDGVHWRYCAAEADILNQEILNGVLQTVTYQAVNISDDGVTISGDPTTDDFVIKVASDTDFIQFWRTTPTSVTMYLTIRKKNRGDPEAPVYWVGEVRSVKGVDVTQSEVTCVTMSSSFERNGLRLSWGRGCPHALYDRNCRVNQNNYAVQTTVEVVNGSSFQGTDLFNLGNDYLVGGYFEWSRREGVIERGMIEGQDGNTVFVLGTTAGLDVGSLVTLYPGCSRTSSECNDKFNNIYNYGGFPNLPGKSPFSNDPVF